MHCFRCARLCSFVTGVALTALSFLASHPAHAAVIVAGDVNGDEAVNAVDVQSLINNALGIGSSALADLDLNGTVNAVDVQLVINAAVGLNIDSDGDGLSDSAENGLGTDPAIADTDEGGVNDGEEVFVNQTDPLSPNDDGGLRADFTATPTFGAIPLSVQFTDTSTSNGVITEWLWDFGDGQTSTEQNPSHDYIAIGAYTVTLTVTDSTGSDSVIRENAIGALEVIKATETIGVSGGDVILPDTTTVTFPAGAVTQDTVISVTRFTVGSQKSLDSQSVLVQLEPSGLTFAQPVSLTIPVPAAKDATGFIASAINYSEANEDIDVGSEISKWQPMPILSENASTVSVELEHFSFVNISWSLPGYVVLDLPGQYLRAGDIVYALTNSPLPLCSAYAWTPGHVGMYMGNKMGTEAPSSDLNEERHNDGGGSTLGTVIESTPFQFVPLLGVRYKGLEESFMNENEHLYLGARRPRFSLTNLDRLNIAQYAHKQKGQYYSLVGVGGGAFPFLTGFAFSCVGLVEKAYDSAGKSIMPILAELPALLPSRHFTYTDPVSDIWVFPHEQVNFSVHAVETAKCSGFTGSEKSPVSTLSGNVQQGMALSQAGQFTWTPGEANVGEVYTISFDYPIPAVSFTASQALTMRVRGLKVSTTQVNLAPNKTSDTVQLTWYGEGNANYSAVVSDSRIAVTPANGSLVPSNSTPVTITATNTNTAFNATVTFTNLDNPNDVRVINVHVLESSSFVVGSWSYVGDFGDGLATGTIIFRNDGTLTVIPDVGAEASAGYTWEQTSPTAGLLLLNTGTNYNVSILSNNSMHLAHTRFSGVFADLTRL